MFMEETSQEIAQQKRTELATSRCHRCKTAKTGSEWAGERENVSLRQESLKRITLLPPDFVLWCYIQQAGESASRALYFLCLAGAEQQGTDGEDLSSLGLDCS